MSRWQPVAPGGSVIYGSHVAWMGAEVPPGWSLLCSDCTLPVSHPALAEGMLSAGHTWEWAGLPGGELTGFPVGGVWEQQLMGRSSLWPGLNRRAPEEQLGSLEVWEQVHVRGL